MTLWFEQIPLDEKFPLGAHTFTEESIIAFGKKYDNQYFHTDPEAAKSSHFGSLVASGWHTGSVGQRLMIDMTHDHDIEVRNRGEEPGQSGPGLGANALEFFVPVRPNDTLSYTIHAKDKRKSNSLAGWGILVWIIEGTNQHDKLAYRCELPALSKLRDYRPTTRDKLMLTLFQLPVIGALIKKLR